MKIKFDEKSKKYIKKNKIKNIVIQVDRNSKQACCGLGSIDFEVFINSKHKVKNFKHINKNDLEIYYEPSLEFYFKDDDEILIKIIGFLNFKKLYVANEINVLK
ncbi:hypothetical protein HV819_01555 [Anaerococcus sp. AGMB00486]|uniref:FeS cluster biogenesis domain-containing protein n=1 Tax=Anaerococcus faecalis TaxID=2742993 RepID=A0ABX2N7N6_9FIRM|nr:hypothetical protein [Anaerococcus faecalis]NVF10703.1 hypothetical protein [Anaerococcus faecalis]